MMTQETAKAVIDRLQGEAGYATGGYVDRLVFSSLDVHEMLNEIEQAIESDKLSVEKFKEQLNTAKKALTNIKLRTERDELETYYVERNHNIRKDAIDALAAIGGDDGQ
ncbi:hypothetical protein [Lactococcus lactis]|uniref:Phage protein n=1 Tax=Lactococcus lactis subsp. lactis A12 TaxID=1137134 RepID=S6F5N7_LACLL|nr:hypothetical protein [Lactococcus lactis]CDG04129.1 Phage protein [Lactococcus lactis subsp. lactis A12]SBW31175.1 Phage protein [Lactococcus lactis subsp. lactis]